jgi:DNA anti-recombination protein RmuC
MDVFFAALLGALVSLAVVSAAYLLFRRPQPAPPAPDHLLMETMQKLQQDVGGLRENVGKLPSADVVEAIKERLASVEGRVPTDLADSVQRLQDSFTRVEAEFKSRKELEERNRAAIQKIEAVVAGAQSRGAAGEEVLAEAFAQFPPEMGDTQFKVNGRPVEFALVLASGKRMPVDSKWPAGKELEQFAAATDTATRDDLLKRIEKAVLKKVEEVTKYIDPASTASVAVAAIPDAAYFACRTAHFDAYRQRVLLMPYSLTIPFLLALYNLHQQFARSVDQENLESALSQMEAYLDQFDDKLENSVERGATMVLNAYQDLRLRISQMRAIFVGLRQAAAPLAEQESLLKK